MNIFTLLAQSANESDDGSGAVLGFLMLAGIIWLIYAACASKPKGFDFSMSGSATPR